MFHILVPFTNRGQVSINFLLGQFAEAMENRIKTCLYNAYEQVVYRCPSAITPTSISLGLKSAERTDCKHVMAVWMVVSWSMFALALIFFSR